MRSGQTVTEYALVLMLIALFSIGIVLNLGTSSASSFEGVEDTISNAGHGGAPGNPGGLVNFTYFPEMPATGETVTFDGPGIANSWDWDFGDGSAHSLVQNPTHAYAAPGSYVVSLTTNHGTAELGIEISQPNIDCTTPVDDMVAINTPNGGLEDGVYEPFVPSATSPEIGNTDLWGGATSAHHLRLNGSGFYTYRGWDTDLTAGRTYVVRWQWTATAPTQVNFGTALDYAQLDNYNDSSVDASEFSCIAWTPEQDTSAESVSFTQGTYQLRILSVDNLQLYSNSAEEPSNPVPPACDDVAGIRLDEMTPIDTPNGDLEDDPSMYYTGGGREGSSGAYSWGQIWLGGNTMAYAGWAGQTFLAGQRYVVDFHFYGTSGHTITLGVQGVDYATEGSTVGYMNADPWQLGAGEHRVCWIPSSDVDGSQVSLQDVRSGTGESHFSNIRTYGP